jgi:hypothetical protein
MGEGEGDVDWRDQAASGWELSEPTEGDDDKRIRRYTVGDVPPFRRFMPTQTRSLGLDSTLG